MNFPHGFTELFGSIAQGNCRVTLAELAVRLELDPDLGSLGKAAAIKQVLDLHKIAVVPGWDKGEFESERILQFAHPIISYEQELFDDLKVVESPCLEYKTSLQLDVKKYEAIQGNPRAEDCKSEEVLYSALKTIAAFANTNGGRLYIGITDDRLIDGLKWDFLLNKLRDADQWELYIRDCIAGKCKDGKMVNEYVKIKLFNVEEKTVARIDVTPRHRLTFVKRDNLHLLYRRQGNRTVQVEMQEMEEFLGARWDVKI